MELLLWGSSYGLPKSGRLILVADRFLLQYTYVRILQNNDSCRTILTARCLYPRFAERDHYFSAEAWHKSNQPVHPTQKVATRDLPLPPIAIYIAVMRDHYLCSLSLLLGTCRKSQALYRARLYYLQNHLNDFYAE